MTAAPPLAEVVARNLASLRARIAAAGRDPEAVTVVAVTKGQPHEACLAALANGLTTLGESYADELAAKAADPALAPISWHFIGGLQRRRIREVAAVVDLWESVDRPELVDELAKRAPGARLLLQVALSDEPGKAGCAWGDVEPLLHRARGAGLVVEGLMGVGPTEGGPEAARPGFRRLAATARDLGLATVSMGMSGDLEVALAEGATSVRVGTALFGPRTRRPAMGAWAQP
jgi:pyridoxal phosphate enzyme (YggS family)